MALPVLLGPPGARGGVGDCDPAAAVAVDGLTDTAEPLGLTFVMENSTAHRTNDVPQLRKVLQMDSSL